MDAAGAAVGVASLGIQLCQGFLKYYQDWKSCHEDISAAYDKINVLRETFAQLKKSLNDPTLDGERKSTTHSCILSCQQGLSKLETLLDKLPTVPQSSAFIARAASATRRAVYPFKTHTFKHITATVDGLVRDLSLALQAIHLDLSAQSHSKVVAVDNTLQTVLGRLADSQDETKALRDKIELLRLTSQQNFDTYVSPLELSKVIQDLKVAEHRRIIAWLHRPNSRDPRSDHRTARDRCLPNTGQWILDDAKYKQWKDSISHLWIYGKAGCGKTILCSTMIEDLIPQCSQERRALACYYFKFTDISHQIYSDLLSSIIQQLSLRSIAVYALLKENYYDEDGRNRTLSKDELLNTILSLSIQEYDEVVLVLDGVDEIPGEEPKTMVLHLLGRIAASLSNVKILLVSRYQTEIAVSMEGISAERLPLHHDPISEDIRSYVTNQLAKDFRLSKWKPDLRARIQSAFERKADGMFMWAYCQLEVLKKIRSSREANIDFALQSLPATLQETYERMLVRALQTHCEETLYLLRWLTFASRPLTLGELHETRRLVEVGRDEDVAWNDPGSIEDIQEMLGDLIHVGPIYGCRHETSNIKGTTVLTLTAAESNDTQSELSNHRVQLAHSSVRDYLLSDHTLHPSTNELPFQNSASHRILARNCLSYFKRYMHSVSGTSAQDDFRKFPLLSYAAVYWSDHIIDDINDRKTRHLNLLTGNPFQSDEDIQHQGSSASPNLGPRRSLHARAGSALYHASRLGCASSVRILIEHGACINAHGGADCIALAVALRGRFKDIFAELLAAGARLRLACGLWNALKWAVYHGFLEETRVLMHAYRSENSRQRDYPKALDIAATRGHLDIVKMLIAAGTSVTSTSRSKSANCSIGNSDVSPMQGTKIGIRLALEGAVLRSHSAIVDVLLEAGARVSDEILALAASKSETSTIRTLLKIGINGDASNDDAKSTALFTAAESGRYGAVSALIEGGADIHAEGGLSCTPLRAACYGGHHEIVELLLKKGTDPNVGSNDARKGTALEAAATCGHIKIVQTLIAANALIDAPGMFGTTALQTALHHGHGNVAQILIDAGANIHAVESNCNAMLCAAIHGGLADYVKKFLDAGADINIRVLGVPLLHFAASQGYYTIVALLLAVGADVKLLDQHHGTALHAACTGRHASIVELLILKGADVNATVHRGTALQVAYSFGHQFIAKLLLAAGANLPLGSAPVVHRLQPRMIRSPGSGPTQPRDAD